MKGVKKWGWTGLALPPKQVPGMTSMNATGTETIKFLPSLKYQNEGQEADMLPSLTPHSPQPGK